ncbi:unnamed protein product [Caenorhabditis bovis]|uniref:MMS19 nucleotide excision repair protein n=1 Tax=Caenorhabditis bovis TaxID=2654633 RepID=A0A8S1EBS7_9PELO|nr:unnamed protein product [Caenorhabditis bovis]
MGEEAERSVADWHKMIVIDRLMTFSQYLRARRDDAVSESLEVRDKALNEIVDVLKSLPPSFLTGEEVGLLLTFFVSQMDSNILSGETLIDGIYHLVMNSKEVPPDSYNALFVKMFQDSNVSEWSTDYRMKHYEIFRWFVQNQKEYMISLGGSFYTAFQNIFLGESSANGIMFMLNLFLFIVKNYEIQAVADNLFDMVLVYYPEKNPVQNRNPEVSRKLIVAKCISCFVSSPYFDKMCFAVVADSIINDEFNDEEIDDICQLLVVACQKFAANAIVEYIEPIMRGIRMAAVKPTTNDVSGTLIKALKGVIEKSRELHDPNTEVFIGQSLIENMEPFVLQAEMGITKKALELFKCAYLNTSDHLSCSILSHVFAWLTTLVQGDTVNVAANKNEIMEESLDYMIEWVELVAQRKEETGHVLQDFLTNILDSIDVSREYVPRQAMIAKYKILKKYLDEFEPSESLISKCKKTVAAEIFSPLVEDEDESYFDFITSLAKRTIEPLAAILVEHKLTTWNKDKMLAYHFSIIHNRHSWEFLKIAIKNLLDLHLVEMHSFTIKRYEMIASRCSNDEMVMWEVLSAFDRVVQKAHQHPPVAETMQTLTLGLTKEKRAEFMTILYERYYASELSFRSIDELDRKYTLSLLQSENIEEVKSLAELPFPPKVHRKFLFAAINRRFIEVNDLADEDFEDLWTAFIKVKAKLITQTPTGLYLFGKLMDYIIETPITDEIDEQYKFLLDFVQPENNPYKCNYEVSTVFWKQKLLYLLVPPYKEIFESASDMDLKKIVGLLPALIDFANTIENAELKDQFDALLPLLLRILDVSDPSTINKNILHAIPIFVKNAQQFDAHSKRIMVNALCEVATVPEVSMATTLDALSSLINIYNADRENVPLELVPKVIRISTALLSHHKRLVRLKSAEVVNLWSLSKSD